METGTVCIKIAGRDARKKCVIVEKIDERFVVIDGLTRRRKCNILHLEPTGETIDLKKASDHNAIVLAFKKMGIEIPDKKSKDKQDKPRMKRKEKEAAPEGKAVKKKSTKK